MKNTKNNYFNSMYKICETFDKMRKEREAAKEKIVETYGWKSEELEAWYEEEKAFVYPYTNGQMKAARAYWFNRDEEEIVWDDTCWDNEFADFIKTFRDAGIKTFVMTSQSTALMKNIHGFINEGCEMEGICTIEEEGIFGKANVIEGIRFKVN